MSVLKYESAFVLTAHLDYARDNAAIVLTVTKFFCNLILFVTVVSVLASLLRAGSFKHMAKLLKGTLILLCISSLTLTILYLVMII